jgi:endo-1,4-beta-mannosidase
MFNNTMVVDNLKVNGRSVANQFVLHNGDNLYIFQSYKSTIAKVDLDTATIDIYRDFDYSRTTARHRNNFFSQLGFDEIATTKGIKKAINDGKIDGYKVIYHA